MKNITIFSLIALMAVAGMTDALAQKRNFKKDRTQRICEELNLTEAQKSKMEEMKTKHQKEMIELKADLDKKKLDHKKLMKSDDLKRADVLKLTDEMNTIKNQISKARATHKMDVYDSLTKEQREIWSERKMDGKRKLMRKGKFNKRKECRF